MTIDAAHRASIYEKLRPILGDEDANVLMSEFPSVEAHELVTKDFLRAELALTRGELREELALTKGELRGDLGQLREELALTRADLRSEVSALETRLTVRLGSAIAASTALLAAIGLLS
jgi:hypothetical protein